MKRLFTVLFIICLLLCGCGSTAGNTDANTPGPMQPEASAAPEATPGSAADELSEAHYSSWRDFLRSLYDEYGNFYFENNAALDCLGWLTQQPQDRPVKFAVMSCPFFNLDERLDYWKEPSQNFEHALTALAEVLGDDVFREYGSYEKLSETLKDEDLLKKLPEEYPEWVRKAENRDEALATYETEYWPLFEELNLEYAVRDAEAFAAQGVDAEVLAAKSISDGRESFGYSCIVTATPEEFLALSETMDGLYQIWIPDEQYLLRFNIHIWPGNEVEAE